ncbi:MAG: hypothetical protein K1W40_03505 [Schaedlerella sp.]|uniref:DUF6147 family protein n=1 Tax=Schaedlerella sp. TaxID=2676057 RepID=UPI0035277484
MKKRIISLVVSILVLSNMLITASINALAEGVSNIETTVDGSRLIYEDYSRGTSTNSILRGEHLMTGDSIITKTGNGRIYTYGQTTADHDVDFVSVIVYVDRYHEDTGKWGQIDGRVKDARDTYFVISTKTLVVDRGYFYRVRCEHFAGNDDEEFYDETESFTDGIWIP